MNEQIIEKLKDCQFIEKLLKMEDDELVVEAFAEEGIEITDEELEELGYIFTKMVEGVYSIPREALEIVAGGRHASMGHNLRAHSLGSMQKKYKVVKKFCLKPQKGDEAEEFICGNSSDPAMNAVYNAVTDLAVREPSVFKQDNKWYSGIKK